MDHHPLRSLRGKLRRWWLTSFRRGYVAEQLARRQGACRSCGRCCRLMYRCQFLNRSNRCFVYGIWRPRNCTAFPIDERDLADVDGQCGFSFSEETVPVSEAVPEPEKLGADPRT